VPHASGGLGLTFGRRRGRHRCADVDQTLSSFLPLLAWPRFRRLLAAAVLEADPDQSRARERAARAERGVWSFDGEDGLRTLVAKAASGDVRWFVAAVDRIAEILGLDGDLDLVDARRAKAIGILAQRARALSLLTKHADDPDERGQEAPGSDEDEDHDGRADEGARSLRASSDGLRGRDLRLARPRVLLHLHLTDSSLRAGDGLVRPEHGDPLTLDNHRAVTFGKWQRQQPSPGTYVFRSPNGYVFLATNQGTQNLGRTPFTRALWDLTSTVAVADVEAAAA
jgi:hypothetical protein